MRDSFEVSGLHGRSGVGTFIGMLIAAFVIAILANPVPPAFAFQGTIKGAGATFPEPVYAKWGAKYHSVKGDRITYQGIGSSGGIRKIKGREVDFGGSDKPLSTVELVKTGLIQFPMIIGGVVPVYNIPGVKRGELRLTTQLLADIFLGKINKWDDPRIKEANPQVRLPGNKITVVHRSDGSGTTWIFTSYLSKISGEWKQAVGSAKKVEWPTGVGAKGNDGVANKVKRTRGSIAYVQFDYANDMRLSIAQLQNLAGNFVKPTMKTFQAAAENAGWDSKTGFIVDLTDQPGAESWPINGVSYILLYKHQDNRAKAKAMLEFFDWCYKEGGSLAEDLDYVPIPASVYKMVEDMWRSSVTVGGQPLFR